MAADTHKAITRCVRSWAHWRGEEDAGVRVRTGATRRRCGRLPSATPKDLNARMTPEA